MIKVLYGGKGEGMARELCEMANDNISTAKGNLVFIDKDDNHIYSIDSSIRFINASDYCIEGPKMFSGFLSGIAAQDFDIETIYIGSFMKIVRHPIATLSGLFGFFERFSEKTGANMVFEINTDEECPDFIKKYR